MKTAGSTSGRTAAAIAAVVAVVLGAAVWIGIASVGAVDRHADAAPIELMVRAQPATYHPLQQAAPAARTVQQRIGDWTPRRGVAIAERALKWINTPYSWAAGGVDGPSFGQAVDADSRNDNKVYGFDCSGLTMYALGPWRSLSHDAAAQYTEVGRFHPALNYLEPGDLVFWSKDGTVGGIGHVAIYVGNGLVVQAPHSGDVVRVTPIYDVESGTMGATRPLS